MYKSLIAITILSKLLFHIHVEAADKNHQGQQGKTFPETQELTPKDYKADSIAVTEQVDLPPLNSEQDLQDINPYKADSFEKSTTTSKKKLSEAHRLKKSRNFDSTTPNQRFKDNNNNSNDSSRPSRFKKAFNESSKNLSPTDLLNKPNKMKKSTIDHQDLHKMRKRNIESF